MDYTSFIAFPPLLTVVETPEFIARAERLLADEERDALIFYLAAHRPPVASYRVRAAFGSYVGGLRDAANVVARG